MNDFLSVQLNQDELLCCPLCGDGNGMHQTTTTIYSGNDAITEIAKDGYTRVWPNDEVQSALNPSARRNGLTIHFDCEFCSISDDPEFDPPSMKLRIYQHKGQTFINWDLEK